MPAIASAEQVISMMMICNKLIPPFDYHFVASVRGTRVVWLDRDSEMLPYNI
jgi:hypothetical protein